MSVPCHILFVEDSADDAELAARALRRSGIELIYERVETPAAMDAALARANWDVVIADYSMPHFDGLSALNLVRKRGLDLPFILVSGTVGEDVAVKAMKAGAHDYVLKDNLARLPPAVQRELLDAEVRRQRKQAESRYRNLFETVPVGILITSSEGKILDANSTFLKMLGFKDVESLKPIDLIDVWVHPDEFHRLIKLIVGKGIVQNFELEFYRRDRSVGWCSESIRAVYGANGVIDHYETVAIEISARKQAEAEVERARTLALEAIRLRSDFMRNMSHEIRTPLNGIVGMSELLAGTELTPEQRECAATVGECADSLLNIVNDILDFSKLSSGVNRLQEVDFDLLEVLENLVSSFAEAARAKRIELYLLDNANLPTKLRGDCNRMRQILRNLISNAIKFTSVGDVLVLISLVEDSADQVLMRFEITDTGIGIPLEARSRLFQPFVQVDGSSTRPYGGAGLGLAIAAQLAEQMGGEVGLESEQGKGARFHLTIRLKKGAPIVRPRTMPPKGAALDEMRAVSVCESAIASRVISESLASLGIATSSFSDSATALGSMLTPPLAAGETFVVIDERLSDAQNFVRSIKTHPSLLGTKVVMLGAEIADANADESIDAWVAKPLRPSDLYKKLFELFSKTDRDGTAAAPRTTVPVEAKHIWRNNLRVLQIGENPLNRSVLSKQLAALGYDELMVEDAARGLEIASHGGCDIVLIDCEMPALNAHQATEKIRLAENGDQRTIVIGLTAQSTDHDHGRCIESGMDDCLRKPIKLTALARALAQKQSHAEAIESLGS